MMTCFLNNSDTKVQDTSATITIAGDSVKTSSTDPKGVITESSSTGDLKNEQKGTDDNDACVSHASDGNDSAPPVVSKSELETNGRPDITEQEKGSSVLVSTDANQTTAETKLSVGLEAQKVPKPLDADSTSNKSGETSNTTDDPGSSGQTDGKQNKPAPRKPRQTKPRQAKRPTPNNPPEIPPWEKLYYNDEVRKLAGIEDGVDVKKSDVKTDGAEKPQEDSDAAPAKPSDNRQKQNRRYPKKDYPGYFHPRKPPKKTDSKKSLDKKEGEHEGPEKNQDSVSASDTAPNPTTDGSGPDEAKPAPEKQKKKKKNRQNRRGARNGPAGGREGEAGATEGAADGNPSSRPDAVDLVPEKESQTASTPNESHDYKPRGGGYGGRPYGYRAGYRGQSRGGYGQQGTNRGGRGYYQNRNRNVDNVREDGANGSSGGGYNQRGSNYAVRGNNRSYHQGDRGSNNWGGYTRHHDNRSNDQDVNRGDNQNRYNRSAENRQRFPDEQRQDQRRSDGRSYVPGGGGNFFTRGGYGGRGGYNNNNRGSGPRGPRKPYTQGQSSSAGVNIPVTVDPNYGKSSLPTDHHAQQSSGSGW